MCFTIPSLIPAVLVIQLWAIFLEVPLDSTFITCNNPLNCPGGSLGISSSMNPTITGQMANLITVCAFYSARPNVMIVALGAQCIRCAFWSLNEDIFEDYYSDYQYAVSIKEDTAYSCLHSPKTTKDKVQYAISREDQYTVLDISVETEFPAIAFNDGVSSKTLSCKPTVSFLNDEIDFRVSFDNSDDEDYTSEKDNDDNDIDIIQSSKDMALPPRDLRHQYLRYEGLQYTNVDILDFDSRLTKIYMREVHKVQVFDFRGLSDLMDDGLSVRMLMEHRDAQGVSLFSRRAWRWLFDIRAPLVHELILEFFSTFRFGEAILDLDTPGALQFQLGGARRRLNWRQFSVALGLHMGKRWSPLIGVSSARDFLGTAPSDTVIRYLILRLCHRLIACSIAGRSQAPKKVTMADLFYLRGMDVGSVNFLYLLARYLRLFAAGRKSGAHISGGQFVARLAEHFGLLTAEILQGLTVIAPALPVIDMAKPVRLQICKQIDDTWDWADLAPILAPQQPPPPPPPLAASRTMPQRMARLEEDVHEIRRALTEKREVIDAMAHDFSRFSTWAITSLARMMDRAGVTYTSYSEILREYQRHKVRQRTGEASTFTAQQDQQQPDP
ncbi:hypothetical protein Tco_0128652 [Tanacetum coccineum]